MNVARRRVDCNFRDSEFTTNFSHKSHCESCRFIDDKSAVYIYPVLRKTITSSRSKYLRS